MGGIFGYLTGFIIIVFVTVVATLTGFAYFDGARTVEDVLSFSERLSPILETEFLAIALLVVAWGIFAMPGFVMMIASESNFKQSKNNSRLRDLETQLKELNESQVKTNKLLSKMVKKDQKDEKPTSDEGEKTTQ